MVYLHGIHGIGGKLIAEITTLPQIGNKNDIIINRELHGVNMIYSESRGTSTYWHYYWYYPSLYAFISGFFYFYFSLNLYHFKSHSITLSNNLLTPYSSLYLPLLLPPSFHLFSFTHIYNFYVEWKILGYLSQLSMSDPTQSVKITTVPTTVTNGVSTYTSNICLYVSCSFFGEGWLSNRLS